MSQQVAALEREAGAVLVERGARGVRLTDAGQAVVRHAEGILAKLAEAEAELEAIAGLRGGRLRMAAFESAAATIMPVAIAKFTEAHPGVELSLGLQEPEEAVAALRAGDIDLAVTFGARGAASDREGDGVDAPPPARRIRCTSCCRRTIRSRASAACGWRTSRTSRGSAARRTASATG